MNQFAVVDTETTGLEEDDQVVELAVALGSWDEKKNRLSLSSTWSSLVRPTVPVKAEARAAHHITDAELRKASPMDEVLESAPHVGDAVGVAHNLEFDARLLRQSGADTWLPPRQLDTYRLAMHAYPDAVRHSNQYLRYYLELELPPKLMKLPPHRALPDAVVTFFLLERLLQWQPVEELLRLSATPALLTTCNIGAWRGKPWASVDVGMLRWILQKDFSEDIKFTARHHLKRRAA